MADKNKQQILNEWDVAFDRIERKGNRKYENLISHGLSFTYCIAKMMSHLAKFAKGEGSDDEHLDKIAFYAHWLKRFKRRKDDRVKGVRP